MDVHVAGPDDARHIARRVLDSQEGTLVEGCLYEVKCDAIYFAVRMADASVVRLVVTDIGRGARSFRPDAYRPADADGEQLLRVLRTTRALVSP